VYVIIYLDFFGETGVEAGALSLKPHLQVYFALVISEIGGLTN
jgi:hypothetical protein